MKTNFIKPTSNATMIVTVSFAAAMFLVATACSNSSKPDAASSDDKPLKSFAQQISSESTKLTVKAGKPFTVPVTVKNPGTETWNITGTYPVNLSYVWFEGTKQLPIEGSRTLLLSKLGPGQEQTLKAAVSSPPVAGEYILKFTMVQERVAWFIGAGGNTSPISVTVE